MISESIQEVDITMSNIYVANLGAPQCIRQTLADTREEINNDAIIVGNFSTPLTTMDNFSRQKINKETQAIITVTH